jgi:hypothetical protein
MISIDMAKQFLMKRISSFRAEKLTEELMVPGMPFVVPSERQSSFLEYLCQSGPAHEHLSAYPDVGKSSSTARLGVDSFA